MAFLLREHRIEHPMLPLPMFRSRQFSAANAVTFAVYAALSAQLFLLPTELQSVVGYSALQSGAALAPITLIMLVLSPRAGRLVAAHRSADTDDDRAADRRRRHAHVRARSTPGRATSRTSCRRSWCSRSGSR